MKSGFCVEKIRGTPEVSIFLLNFIEVSKEKKYVNPLDFNFPESHILLIHSTLPNCNFCCDVLDEAIY